MLVGGRDYILSPAAVLNIIVQLGVEFFFLQQLLQRKVHAVIPVMAGISGVVDPLFRGVLAAQRLAHTQDVLQLENAPHGR